MEQFAFIRMFSRCPLRWKGAMWERLSSHKNPRKVLTILPLLLPSTRLWHEECAGSVRCCPEPELVRTDTGDSVRNISTAWRPRLSSTQPTQVSSHLSHSEMFPFDTSHLTPIRLWDPSPTAEEWHQPEELIKWLLGELHIVTYYGIWYSGRGTVER